jgi:hypothetical protein
MSRSSQDAWQRLASLSLDWQSGLSRSSSCCGSLDPFVWTEKADEVFQELKQYLTTLLVMVAPEPSEHLLLYIAAKVEVMSMVLVAERPKSKQHEARKGALAAGFRSLDSDPTEGPYDQ